MASKIGSAITQCTKSKKIDDTEMIASIDDFEEEENNLDNAALAKEEPVQSGLLWRMSSGAVGGVYNIATGAAGMGYNTTKWVVGKGAEIGSTAVNKTKDVSGSVIGKTAEVGASIVQKLPRMAKPKDKKE